MRKDYIKEDRLTNNTHIRRGSFMMNSAESLIKEAILFLVAILGSVLGYVSRTWGTDKVVKYSRIGFSTLSAVFILLLLRALCSALGLSWEWTVVVVGFFSWMGTEITMTFIEKLIHKHLGITHVYIQTDTNKRSDSCPIVPGGVYDLDSLQGSISKSERVGKSASSDTKSTGNK